jgi:hypothetical protein
MAKWGIWFFVIGRRTLTPDLGENGVKTLVCVCVCALLQFTQDAKDPHISDGTSLLTNRCKKKTHKFKFSDTSQTANIKSVSTLNVTASSITCYSASTMTGI